MISLTGGFNQQYMGAEIKVAKERLVRDTLSLSDAITSYAFRTRINNIADSLSLSEAIVISFRENIDNIVDTLVLGEAIETALADV